MALTFGVFVQDAKSQKDSSRTKASWKEKFYLGGNFGLQFGNSTVVNLSPLLGYKVTEKIHVGIGGTYLYYRFSGRNFSFESHTYGGRVFSRYYFIPNAFAHVETEMLNGEWIYNEPRRTVTSIFVGGGYSQPVGRNAAITIMGLYNLNESVYSPYATNPILRVGFNFGL